MKNEDGFAAGQMKEINARIEAACRRANRNRDVVLVGASKTVSPERLRAFIHAGLKNCGENYVQEGAGKIASLPAVDVSWHFIGALQSNKAREAVELFDVIHSVDRISLARELDKAARAQNKTQQVLLSINIGEEKTKSGCAPKDVFALAQACAQFSNLAICGLMCLPPFDENAENTRAYFRRLRQLRDDLIERESANEHWHLSMGMSNNFEVAIEEGASLIRLGTALFGEREKKVL